MRVFFAALVGSAICASVLSAIGVPAVIGIPLSMLGGFVFSGFFED